ncbi:hypothetical protein [Cohnella thailandensis]|uniref:Family 2 glycosyl transferase n=1 Tax=Cohnella thailandensis TaxID=557557 RepID=A0A841SZ11_9BACL|nr:hypothetical protein [Cohnella thailandensis]MBB6634857.1 hypothetical protein [Cohnella thailandensis]MBP1975921.1 hypothetical protein [Cohnella thailandensis]
MSHSQKRAWWKGGKGAAAGLVLLAAVAAGGFYLRERSADAVPAIESAIQADGTQIKFKTEGETVQIFRDGKWEPLFLQGVNLGATVPGYFPGEFPITRDDYMNWFGQIKEMGANVIRVYTRHQPVFYESLVAYNRKHADDPLYFIQGIWSPEEQLIEKKDAYDADIVAQFREEIASDVKAVYGDLEMPDTQGKSSGDYKANAGPYLLGWSIGTEWDPEMVANTNKLHADKAAYTGDYFGTTAKASPFEAWLAGMVDFAAQTEAAYGWQHPMSFTNWVTTDVLSHPNEPLFTEDMAAVDATHLKPLHWSAGYFASYHVYPYYPDFFRYNAEGKGDTEADTYAAYLKELKAYHAGMPIMVTEYGVPSSSGISHVAPLGRSQGGHNEVEQGEIDAELTETIHDEGYAGAILFMWQDEWFKKTWNTMPMELPEDRRAYWLNVLTNEKQFGLLGMYSGLENKIRMDGDDSDWKKLKKDEKSDIAAEVPGIAGIEAAHDEAYVYLGIHLDHDFDPSKERIQIGTDTLPGGNKHGEELAGKTLDEGLETLLTIGSDEETSVKIAANYDMEKRLYGYVYGMIVMSEKEIKDDSGLFNEWKLPVSLKMEPPDTKYAHPFEDSDVGSLRRGTNSPASAAYDSLAMWQYEGDFIEVRIPWMLLGLADPSSLTAVSYEMPDKAFKTTAIDGIRFVPWIVNKETGEAAGLDTPDGGAYPVSQLAKYTWSGWDAVTYTERLKPSYSAMQETFKRLNATPKTGGN